MKRALSLAFGLVLAGGCLWLFFRGIENPDLLRARILGADPVLLLLLVVSAVAHMVVRAWRWKTLLGKAGDGVPFMELVSAVSIGYMAILLPARLGEVIRPTVLSRRTNVPVATSLATVAAERIALDLPCLLLFLALWLVLPAGLSGMNPGVSPQRLAALRATGGLFLAVALAALIGAVVVARRREVVSAWLSRLGHREGRVARKVASVAGNLLDGLQAFGSFGGILRVAVESVAIWAVIAAGIHCGVAACGVTLAPAATLIIVPVTAVGIASGTPGGAGTYQLAMREVLVQLLGAPEDAAVAAGIVVHAVSLIPVILMGGWFALRGGLSGARGHAAATAGDREQTGEALP